MGNTIIPYKPLNTDLMLQDPMNTQLYADSVPSLDLSGLSVGGAGRITGGLYDSLVKPVDVSAIMETSYNSPQVSALQKAYDNGSLGTGPDAPKSFLEEAGILDDKGNLLGVSKDGWGAISGLASMYDTFFGTGADIRDAQLDMLGTQKDLLKQQLASNKEALENRRTFNSNWAKASNAVMGNGLAASANG